MSFHEVLFPSDVAWGASGGPKFKTAVYAVTSGYEQRTLDWKDVRAEYDVSHTVKRPEARDALTNFFMCRRGMAHGFRFKDWNDYVLRQEIIGYGDNIKRQFQITKRYTSDQGLGASWTYDRKLTKIAWGTVAGVTVGDTVVVRSNSPTWSDIPANTQAYTLDENTGVMTYRYAPAGAVFPGTAEVSAYTPVVGGALTSTTPNGVYFSGMIADPEAGYIFLKGANGPETGVCRYRMEDGVEDVQATSTAIAFPITGAQDSGKITSMVAAGNDSVYVAVGNSTRPVLYRLDNETFSILAAHGVADSTNIPLPGEPGHPGKPGCVSHDGTRLLMVNAIGGTTTAFPLFDALTLEPLGPADCGTVPAGNPSCVCPYDVAGFAIAISKPTGIEVWDDAGNLIFTLGSAGASVLWLAWDAGDTLGLVVGWRDAAGGHITKHSVIEQRFEWTISTEDQALVTGATLSPGSRINNKLAWTTGSTLWVLDTRVGELAVRACPPALSSENVLYDGVRNKLYSSPAYAGRRIVDTAAEDYVGAEAVKIGYGEFHVPVRFNTDALDHTHDHYEVTSWSGIELIEVRDWAEIKL